MHLMGGAAFLMCARGDRIPSRFFEHTRYSSCAAADYAAFGFPGCPTKLMARPFAVATGNGDAYDGLVLSLFCGTQPGR